MDKEDSSLSMEALRLSSEHHKVKSEVSEKRGDIIEASLIEPHTCR